MVQASVSAPRPFRSTSPETKIPTAQLVSIRFDEERRQREAERPQVEAEERDREQRHRHHADREADDAHHHQRRDEFGGPQRRDHQVAEVARPHLLEKRDREPELAAEQDVPQHHRADQHTAGTRIEIGSGRRGRSAGSPTSASARPASRSARASRGHDERSRYQ